MKLVIFNVKYSPNLGDGVIAECLEHMLRAKGQFLSVVSLDVAGRAEFSAPGSGRRRAQLLAVLDRLPEWGRDLVVTVALRRLLTKRLRPAWREQLADAQFALIGGGQLFQDGDLNFPMKLAAAADECADRKIPLGIYAVGVASSKSFRGRKMLARPLASAKPSLIAVRDQQSADNLGSYGFMASEICFDPGVLASRVWPREGRAIRERPLIGVCITHPSVVRHHASNGCDLSVSEGVSLYRAVIESLTLDGNDVVCFTNGAGEDELMMQLVRGDLAARSSFAQPIYASRASNPEALASLTSSLDCVVGHRLHAAIVAFSYGVPAVGFRWDNKLTAFFEAVGVGHHVVDLDAASATKMGHLARSAMLDRVPQGRRQGVMDQAERSIEHLIEVVGDVTGRELRRSEGARRVEAMTA